MCSSAHFIRRGKDTKGRVRYSCNSCDKNFTAETWEMAATRAERIALAIKAVRDGVHSARASRHFHVSEAAVKRSFGENEPDAAE